MSAVPRAVRAVLDAVLLLARLAASTTRICLRYRVTGLAAEAGFFALLSLPPLVLGLVGTLGYVGEWIDNDVVSGLRTRVSELAGTFLTPESVESVILPTFDDVARGGRFDVISIGFVLSLWSGSRALNVYVDTVTIMYGLNGRRGIVATRSLSFSLYVASLLVGVVLIPLVLVGPSVIVTLLNEWGWAVDGAALSGLYWPVVSTLAVLGLATLYHLATPVRSPFIRDTPGAVLALAIWVLSSFGLRLVISHSVGGTSIYGPLATPIVVLTWLYFLAIAVLIGAALNAAIDERFPTPVRVLARRRLPTTSRMPVTPMPVLAAEPVDDEPHSRAASAGDGEA
jgi:membrane protein